MKDILNLTEDLQKEMFDFIEKHRNIKPSLNREDLQVVYFLTKIAELKMENIELRKNLINIDTRTDSMKVIGAANNLVNPLYEKK